MRRAVLISAVVAACGLAVVLGMRAKSNGAAAVAPAPAAAPRSLAEVAGKSAAATPADRLIAASEEVIKRQPSDPRGYNHLASAYMQKARETGDFAFNSQAEASLANSFKAAPDNYDGLKLRAKLLLTLHRFSEALEVARRAQSLNPRDHDVYGVMTDALVELGDYPAAVNAAQAMVDLRPDTSSYSRISYLRSLHGDTDGAVAAMRTAAESANPQNPEGVAWCRVHLGDELVSAGRRAEAEREYDRALFIFPDYHLALAAKARARFAAGDADAAVDFYRRAVERVPLPEYAAALGDVYAKLGRADEARRQYELVEFVERAGGHGETYSRQLAVFWADHGVRLDEALAAAERERATRNDIYTADALAWCLYKKGRFAEAGAAMKDALRLGTRDPRLHYHAGMIANALGDRRGAAKHLRDALKINATFDVLQADEAKRTLRAVGG